MKASTQHIKNLLVSFSHSGIAYAIIRNYEFLFNEQLSIGKDLDMVVEKKQLKQIDALVKQQGFVQQPISPFSHHVGYAKYLPQEEKLVKLHFHVGGISGSHVVYLPATTILQRKQQKGPFFVLSDEDQLITLFIHGGMDKGKQVKQKYTTLFNTLVTKELDMDYIKQQFNRLVGKKLCFLFMECIRKKDIEPIKDYRSAKKRAFVSKNPLRLLKAGYVISMSACWHGLRRLKPSPLISFIGMDGTGKTTATNNLLDIFQKNKLNARLVYTGRGRANLLPIQFFGRKYKRLEKKIDEQNEKKTEQKKETKTQSTPPSPSFKRKIIYTLAAPVFALDLYLRYLIQIFPKRHCDTLVITDRYSSDLLLMKNVPSFLRKTLFWFFPKPTLTIYLHNEPKILYQRKPGHPQGDLERQQVLFSTLLPYLNPNQIKSETEQQTKKEVAILAFNTFLEAWK